LKPALEVDEFHIGREQDKRSILISAEQYKPAPFPRGFINT